MKTTKLHRLGDLPALLKPGQTLAGLDLGTRTIGVAVSDRNLTLANPRQVIKRTKFAKDAALLLSMLDADNAGAIVLGLPINMDGTEGPRCQATRAFERNLRSLTARPVVFWDERLSTVAAERSLIAQDMSRAKRKERIDSAAAAFILQGALDHIHSAGSVAS